MRRFPKLRKVCKWTGLVLSVLLLVVWVGSAWYSVGRTQFSSRCIHLEIYSGSISWQIVDKPYSAATERVFPPRLEFRREKYPGILWLFEHISSSNWGRTSYRTRVPLWLPLLACSALAGWAWRRDRRLSKPGLCTQCSYDMRGLEVCPECGVGVKT